MEILTVIFISVFAPIVLVTVLWLALSGTHPGPKIAYIMDFTPTSPGTFLAIYDRLCPAFGMIFGAGSIGAVLAAIHGMEVTAALLISAALYAFLCNIWMILCYQGYSHNHESYTPIRYALTLTLGILAVVMFVWGTIDGITRLLSK